MAKIIHFPSDQANVVEALEDILARAKNGEVISFVFAAKLDDGNVATSYGAADFGTRCELVGHIQADTAWAIVKANVDLL